MPHIHTPPPPPRQPPVLIGEVRRFGAYGILYEVIGIVNADTVRIRVLDTNEELSYALAKTLNDPRD